MAEESGKNFWRATLPGLALTVAPLLSILVLGWVVFGDSEATNPGGGNYEKNERLAVRNLRGMARAQERYRSRASGTKEYAPFFALLWQDVDRECGTERLGYISQKLARAMGPLRAMDGYYYKDLHCVLEGARTRAMDPARQWAVAAVPARFEKSGRFVFVTDASGRVFSKRTGYSPSCFPEDPESSGWVLLPG